MLVAVRENEISKATDLREVGAIGLSCGHRQSQATEPGLTRYFPPTPFGVNERDRREPWCLRNPLATYEGASVSCTRTSNAQRDPARNQHNTDHWRNPLTVTGLNSEVRISDLDALRLGAGDGHDQGRDAEHNQEQACKQQYFHIKSSLSSVPRKSSSGVTNKTLESIGRSTLQFSTFGVGQLFTIAQPMFPGDSVCGNGAAENS
jgi:hypothetical protein